MHTNHHVDGGLPSDWGKTSEDYATWRPDYPPEFYERMAACGIGLPGQKLLDLGTGVGFLAREFARRGARVTGMDIAEGQIAVARAESAREGLELEFRTAPAEETGLPAGTFDAVTASQCWLYFDQPRALAEVRRVLRPGGVLAPSHFSWVPREDEVARASEALILKHNPSWSSADWSGVIPESPLGTSGDLRLVAKFVFDAEIPFTRESWRGRIRASRGIGASLDPEGVRRFDEEHEAMLADLRGPEFTVLHRIDAHVYDPAPMDAPSER